MRRMTMVAAVVLALGGVAAAAGPAAADEDGPCAEIPPGINVITGTPLPDVIFAGPGADLVLGLEGDDVIYGMGGNDFLFGGPGLDKLYGQGGNDCLDGGAGAPDEGYGGAGANLCTTPATEVQVNC